MKIYQHLWDKAKEKIVMRFITSNVIIKNEGSSKCII